MENENMKIYESIAAVQADVDFIGKDKKAQTQNYKYRGVDQVLNTLHPLFAKHKVFAVPDVLDIPHREIRQTKNGVEMTYQVVRIRYTFYAEDGSNISATVLGEAMDSGDKVSNKCMSVAYKYACFQILSIPTEETCADPDDGQEEFGDGENGKAPQAGTGEPLPQSRTKKVQALIKGTSYGMIDVIRLIDQKFPGGKGIEGITEEQFDAVMKIIGRAVNAERAGE